MLVFVLEFSLGLLDFDTSLTPEVIMPVSGLCGICCDVLVFVMDTSWACLNVPSIHPILVVNADFDLSCRPLSFLNLAFFPSSSLAALKCRLGKLGGKPPGIGVLANEFEEPEEDIEVADEDV